MKANQDTHIFVPKKNQDTYVSVCQVEEGKWVSNEWITESSMHFRLHTTAEEINSFTVKLVIFFFMSEN